MRKPTFGICENKGADQLHSNCEADQCLHFLYMDSTIPLLLKPQISSFKPVSVTVHLGLCQTWPKTTMLVFSCCGLNESRELIPVWEQLATDQFEPWLSCSQIGNSKLASYNLNLILSVLVVLSHIGYIWIIGVSNKDCGRRWMNVRKCLYYKLILSLRLWCVKKCCDQLLPYAYANHAQAQNINEYVCEYRNG